MSVLKLSSNFAVGQAVKLFDGWGEFIGMGLITAHAGPYSLKVMTVTGAAPLISTSGVEPL